MYTIELTIESIQIQNQNETSCTLNSEGKYKVKIYKDKMNDLDKNKYKATFVTINSCIIYKI
jgi:hypothetical protein